MRLGRSLPELCMQAAPEAIDALLLAVDELEADGPPAKRTLTLRPNERRKQCSTVRILLSPVSEDLRQMSITRQDRMAVLEFTPKGLEKFREALSCWRAGGEDFSIHPHPERNKKSGLGTKDLESGELWFWTPRMDP